MNLKIKVRKNSDGPGYIITGTAYVILRNPETREYAVFKSLRTTPCKSIP